MRLGNLPLWSHRGGSPLRQVRKAGQGSEGKGREEGQVKEGSKVQ